MEGNCPTTSGFPSTYPVHCTPKRTATLRLEQHSTLKRQNHDWKDTVRKTHPAPDVFKAGDDIDRHPGREEQVALLRLLALRRVSMRLQI